jgi:hypothetical protein
VDLSAQYACTSALWHAYASACEEALRCAYVYMLACTCVLAHYLREPKEFKFKIITNLKL